MTADLSFLTQLPGRCPKCFLHIEHQGHRATIAGEPTGCMNEGPLGVILGRQLGAEGMARAEAAHPGDVEIVDAAIQKACASGERFSANDFRHLVERVEQPAVIGARIRAWSASKRIRRVGDVPSSLPGTHAHRIGLYEAVA